MVPNEPEQQTVNGQVAAASGTVCEDSNYDMVCNETETRISVRSDGTFTLSILKSNIDKSIITAELPGLTLATAATTPNPSALTTLAVARANKDNTNFEAAQNSLLVELNGFSADTESMVLAVIQAKPLTRSWMSCLYCRNISILRRVPFYQR